MIFIDYLLDGIEVDGRDRPCCTVEFGVDGSDDHSATDRNHNAVRKRKAYCGRIR